MSDVVHLNLFTKWFHSLYFTIGTFRKMMLHRWSAIPIVVSLIKRCISYNYLFQWTAISVIVFQFKFHHLRLVVYLYPYLLKVIQFCSPNGDIKSNPNFSKASSTNTVISFLFYVSHMSHFITSVNFFFLVLNMNFKITLFRRSHQTLIHLNYLLSIFELFNGYGYMFTRIK